MSPVFGHGRLRLYLLALLEDRPRHGYELIQEMEERSGGTYTPSAGTIYPRLGKLEEEGLVRRETDGRRTMYAITDEGRQEVSRRREELTGIEQDLTDSVRRIADEVRSGVDRAMRSLRAELAAAAAAERSADRSVPRPPAPTDRAPDRGAALRDADVVLTDFRQRIRGDLRAASVRGPIPADLVRELEHRLDAVRGAIADRLP
ncbi:MAG TPA: PadR family transcriptional regulator [Naasia sp.]